MNEKLQAARQANAPDVPEMVLRGLQPIAEKYGWTVEELAEACLAAVAVMRESETRIIEAATTS